MEKIRKRLTFANVVACIALFVALGGASYAAVNLPKNSVGTKQIKKNAVKTNKLAAKAVKAGKIAKNAITTNRLRNAAVTGAKINAPTTPFGQIVSKVVGTASVPFETEKNYPLDNPTYTQPAGRADQYLGEISVKFSAGCEAPRSATAYLLLDAANPAKPTALDIIGLAVVADEGAGEVTRTGTFTPLAGVSAPWRLAPSADTPHTFSVLMAAPNCKKGSGVTATGATIDLIGTK